MMKKKASLTELFYLTLLISALRPPDSSLFYRREPVLQSLVDSPVIADDICFLQSFYRYRNLNGALAHDYDYPSPKGCILQQEAHQVLDYINSLGRYSQPLPFNSQLFAFPVSRGGGGRPPSPTEDSQDISHSSPTSVLTSGSTQLEPNTEDSSTTNSDDLLATLGDFNLTNINFNNLNLDFDLTDDGFFDNNNNGLFSDPATPVAAAATNVLNDQQDTLHDVDALLDGVLAEQDINEDELLVDNSVMFPVLDPSDDGDVNDLLGELELLLSNETDSYGQEWQSSTFYTPLQGAEPSADYSLYDSANLATDGRSIENCTIYEPLSSAAVTPVVSTNSTASLTSFATGSNFGTVLYSSLTTLSNGNEHVNSELTSNQLQPAYSGSEISDVAYMSNVSNISVNNISTPDCFYNGYMPEEEIPPPDINGDNSDNSQAHQQFPYQQSQPHQQQQPQQQQQQPQQQPEAGYQAHPINHTSQFPSQTSEDCFDKNSDSAVSSMSSDRVHSYSDNDWAETSSESSSYNGEVNLSDYSNNDNKCNSSAQKKYRLFGKCKSGDYKNVSQTGYYVEYSQNNGYPPYPESCQSGGENFQQQPQQQQHPISHEYYAVNHNHTYSQSAQPVPLSSLSPDISGSWSANDSADELPVVKKENDSSSSSKTGSSKKQSNGDESHKQRDPHLNRDEKRARALKIPISTHDIINLPIDEFNERLTKYELTEMQLSLIRDIRRRGKNKVAAQNCRKRKLDQIMGLQSEVDGMFSQKNSLESQYNQLLMLRELARDKYTKLYQFVVEASSSRQPFFELTSSPPGFPDKDSSQEVQIGNNVGSSFAMSTNISSVPPFGIQGDYSKQE